MTSGPDRDLDGNSDDPPGQSDLLTGGLKLYPDGEIACVFRLRNARLSFMASVFRLRNRPD